MKNTKKIFLVLLAMLAAFTLASCKAADDDDDKKSSVTTVATFYGVTDLSEDGATVIPTVTLTFYSDKSYNLKFSFVLKVDGKIKAQERIQEAGTYTGNPKLNGKIVLTKKYEYNEKTNKLEKVNPSSYSVEIIDGKITDSEDGVSITLKRQ